MLKLKDYFKVDNKGPKGLLPLEWVVLGYLLFTAVLMLLMQTRLHNAGDMLELRIRVVVLMGALWGLYRFVPSRAMMLVRVCVQLAMLGDWYPDTYEFNRCFNNLDHVFAVWEQAVFGFQPALEFSRVLPWGIVSEPLDLGYASYYPIIAFTALFYFFQREKQFQRVVFVIMLSFFIFYVVFIFVPVAGPTFYFKAVGVDIIEQGVFPAVGNYFETHHDLVEDCLPSPGWSGGPMWQLVEIAKHAGERPTAAFPSSHVGITTVCMLLLWKTNNRKVFYWILPLAILMFFATFYIQAHYAIDAFAGLASGVVLFYTLWYGYGKIWKS